MRRVSRLLYAVLAVVCLTALRYRFPGELRALASSGGGSFPLAIDHEDS